VENSKPEHQREYYLGITFVIIGTIAFSAKAVMIKLSYAYCAAVDPISLMMLRMVMALPFFLLVAFWTNRNTNHEPLFGKDWVAICCLGVLGYYMASLLDFKGLQYISAGLERLILFLYPTFVVLLSAIFLKRRINRSEILALMLSYAGIMFVILGTINVDSSNVITGGLLIAGSALSFALFMMGSGEMIKRIGSTRFTAYVMTVSCIVTILHYVIAHDLVLPDFPKQVYGLALMLAIISTVIPAFLMNAGIRRVGASSASIMSSIGPVSTLILACFLLGEVISNVQIIGTSIVIVSVYLLGRSKRYT